MNLHNQRSSDAEEAGACATLDTDALPLTGATAPDRISTTARSDCSMNETALQNITQRNALKSPFLRLPSEIRNAIYRYALGGYEIYATMRNNKFFSVGRPQQQEAWEFEPVTKLMALNLPLVCRQIRIEAGAQFVFKFNSLGTMKQEHFPRLISTLTVEQKNNIEFIRTGVSQKVETFGTLWAKYSFESLKKLPSLKRVEVRQWGRVDEEERKWIVEKYRKIAEKPDLEVDVYRISRKPEGCGWGCCPY